MPTITKGATSQSIDIFIEDSSSTIGAGLAGLVFNSAGLAAYYRRGATGSATVIALATQTVGGAYSSGGFVEVQATNMKGVYRLDIPDAVLATGVDFITIDLYGATNMAPCIVRIELVDIFLLDSAGRANVGQWLDVAVPAVVWANIAASGKVPVPTTAKAGSAGTNIKTNLTHSTNVDYNGRFLFVNTGTGAGNSRKITATLLSGTTVDFTIETAFASLPADTNELVIL